MNALTFSNNNSNESHLDTEEVSNSKNSSAPTAPNSKNKSTLITGTSPRNYEPSYYSQANDNSNFVRMNNNSTTEGAENSENSKRGSRDDIGRFSRQDSISFYTNFGQNGPRFSTDSNSSISNFLNLPAPTDQIPAYDSNGRGLSVYNNLFLPPNSTSTQLSQQNNQNYMSSTDYSSFRRPSEQLEPFNPAVKLKAPSFSKKNSIYVPGTSFSENSSDFDFFSKRDSIKVGRQQSFSNNNSIGDGSDFDIFAKRDSIKNGHDEVLDFKDVSFKSESKQKRETKSEPETDSKDDSSIPNRPSTSLGNKNISNGSSSDTRPRPNLLPYNEYDQQRAVHNSSGRPLQHLDQTNVIQQSPITNPQYSILPQQHHIHHQQHPHIHDEHQHQQQQRFQNQNSQIRAQAKIPTQNLTNQIYQYEPSSHNQYHEHSIRTPSPTGDNNIDKIRRNAIQPLTAAKRARSNKNNKPQQYLSPSIEASHIASSDTTNAQYTTNANNGAQRLVPQSENSPQEEGRPLLGATKVDQLMLVIQARKKGIHKQIPRADDGSIIDNGNGILPQETELVGGIDKPRTKAPKHHECSYCHKTFTQSTHLEVHVRSHIGYKPFECNYCGKRFTQGGNLRTHLRLHTGEKPYICETCGRSFSRKGNLAAHRLTHDNLKPFECKLDNCNKAFTQLGNLKAHQNRFHLETLNELTRRLAEVDPQDLSMKQDERDLLNYFADLYKNSNRGIKGRGKRATSPSDAQQLQQDKQPHSSQQQNANIYAQLPNDSNLNLNFDSIGGGFSNDIQDQKSDNIAFKSVDYHGQ